MKPRPRRTQSPTPKKPRPARTAEAAPASGERLQKILAGAGLASRREVERWIEAGRVTVAGRTAKLGDRAVPGEAIHLDGKPVRLPEAATRPRVLLYHKPVGELVTRSDPEGRPTVFARLPPGRWIAVGRLDINSSGLLLFTDSGETANRLMHPRYEMVREYLARVQGPIGARELEKLTAGVHLDDGPAAFERIEPVVRPPAARPAGAAGTNRWFRVRLREGRNREVRRLFEAVGGRVSRLVRVQYGPVSLPRDLPAGRWRELPARQAQELFGA